VTDNDMITDVATQTILIVNRPPVIVSHVPTSSSVDVASNHSELFVVVASDPDGDVLSYTWRLDAVQVGADSSTYTFNESVLTVYLLNITVSDGQAQDWYEWTVTVSTGGNGDNNPPSEDAFPWWVVIVIVVVVILVVLLLLFSRRKKREEPEEEEKKPQAEEPKEAPETKEPEPVQEKETVIEPPKAEVAETPEVEKTEQPPEVSNQSEGKI